MNTRLTIDKAGRIVIPKPLREKLHLEPGDSLEMEPASGPGDRASHQGRHRISGEQAMLFIADIRERLSIIALDGDEYAGALQTSADRGIVGGGIYDAMLALCALKAKVEILYTWNIRHYHLCGPKVARLLRTP